MNEKREFYAVMKAMPVTAMRLENGAPLRWPADGPQRFIPVFDTREQAVAFDGSDEHVVKLEGELTHDTLH